MFVVGDFKGHAEEAPIEDRKAISVDKNNFRSVMKEAGLTLSTAVSNKLEENADDLPVNLEFQGLDDFSPDSIARQVPELKKQIGRASCRERVEISFVWVLLKEK